MRGSNWTDHNGQVIEEYMDEKILVYSNDGKKKNKKTTVNMNMGKESVLHLTLVLSYIVA